MPITIDAVSKLYETREGTQITALDKVSTRIEDGQFVSMVGPSGCGKSTLLSLIAGLTDVTYGTISGIEESAGSAHSRPSVIFQHALLLPWRTVLENVLLPSEVGGEHRGAHGSKQELTERARELLRLVGLEGFENRYPRELSGGMQQRVSIARGMLLDSHLMLFDEPFSALDEFTREQMHEMLLRIWEQKGFTAVFVTHNIPESIYLSDTILVMTPRPGRLAEEIEVTLPRPRHPGMHGTAEFADLVGRVRRVMDEYWQGVEGGRR